MENVRMKTIPTAEEFFDKRSKELGFENWTNVIVQQEWTVIEELPIEFAQLHVDACKEEIKLKVRLTPGEWSHGRYINQEVDLGSIDNCYKDKIK